MSNKSLECQKILTILIGFQHVLALIQLLHRGLQLLLEFHHLKKDSISNWTSEWEWTCFPQTALKQRILQGPPTCSSLPASVSWVLWRSFWTRCSFAVVSSTTFSCDTITPFFTLFFPSSSRKSPCSFLMMSFAWKETHKFLLCFCHHKQLLENTVEFSGMSLWAQTFCWSWDNDFIVASSDFRWRSLLSAFSSSNA